MFACKKRAVINIKSFGFFSHNEAICGRISRAVLKLNET